MKREKAIRLLVECAEKEIQRISVSANLHEVHGLPWSSAVGASRRRKELREAVKIVQQDDYQLPLEAI